jgi:hypothetical protein
VTDLSRVSISQRQSLLGEHDGTAVVQDRRREDIWFVCLDFVHHSHIEPLRAIIRCGYLVKCQYIMYWHRKSDALPTESEYGII